MMPGARDSGEKLADRTVLVRASFGDGVTSDLGGLLARLAGAGARVAVIAGLGDPSDDVNPALSLARFVEPLSEAAGRPVTFIGESIGPGAEAGLDRVAFGEIALLENLRFHRARRHHARSFALRLSVLGDCFIDAGQAPLSADGWQSHLASLLPGPEGRQQPNAIEEEV